MENKNTPFPMITVIGLFSLALFFAGLTSYIFSVAEFFAVFCGVVSFALLISIIIILVAWGARNDYL